MSTEYGLGKFVGAHTDLQTLRRVSDLAGFQVAGVIPTRRAKRSERPLALVGVRVAGTPPVAAPNVMAVVDSQAFGWPTTMT
jgi:hypothetical protein